MARGGSRPGERRGGRRKGTPNKRTAERQARLQEAAKAIEGTLAEAFQGDAHALLMRIYKDASLPLELRLDAAKAAIAYETPKLPAIELSGGPHDPVPAPSPIEIIIVDAGVPLPPGDAPCLRSGPVPDRSWRQGSTAPRSAANQQTFETTAPMACRRAP